MIRQLLTKGLLVQQRTAGQASTYDISEEALMQLGVSSKKDLPRYAELAHNDNLNNLLAS